MHAIPRLAVAVGLLGLLLMGCQVSAQNQRIVEAIPRFLSGPPPTPGSASSPAPAALPPNTGTPTLTPSPKPPPAPIPEVPPELHDPGTVAAALAGAEKTIHAATVAPQQMRDAARAQQRALDAVAEHPDWRDAVVAAVPGDLHDTVAANTEAAVDLRELNRASDDLPAWQVTDPPPAAELERWYMEAQQQSGIPWAYLAAINLVETRMGRIHGDSIAGAQGPMQFLPDTWQQYGNGGDVHDPHAAILAAGRFLQVAGGPDDMAKALHEYNPSDLYVSAVTAYAQRMLADPRAFIAYYEWQADAAITSGDVILPTGFTH